MRADEKASGFSRPTPSSFAKTWRARGDRELALDLHRRGVAQEPGFVAWESNPQAQALRVDLQNGAFFVLPYSHFAYAHLQREGDNEILCVTFSSHEVRVNGRNLRELGLALQKLGVDWIREAPGRYAGLVARGRAFIEQIEIAEISEVDAPRD